MRISFLLYLFVFVVVKSDENNTEEKKDETSSLPELKIEILEEGEGCGIPTTNTSRVLVHYEGRFYKNNQTFDSSYDRGQPYRFWLHQRGIIKGWQEGLLTMCPGEKRRLTIPPHLAYGEKGVPGSIPPNSTLVYDIELLSFDNMQMPKPKTAKERLEAKRKHRKLMKMQEKLRGKEQPDGSRIVNPPELDEDYEDEKKPKKHRHHKRVHNEEL